MSTVFHNLPTDKYQEIISRRANEAILKGAVVKYHTDGIKVVNIDTDDSLALACGVALEGAAADADVLLCKSGVCDVLVDGTADVAIGDRMVASATVAGEIILDGVLALTDVSERITPLEAQATNDGTLTMCKVVL